MSCPTCDATTECIVATPCTLWCPRCGTLVKRCFTGPEMARQDEVIMPKLVERCREFRANNAAFDVSGHTWEWWRRLGIEESINLPAGRPTNEKGA